MIRIFAFFVLVAAIAVAAVWVADEPGHVEITWGVYLIETSPAALVGGAALAAAIAATIYLVLRWFWFGPRRVSKARTLRRQRHGYLALTQGLVSAAAGDSKGARRLARRANLLLGEPPLTLLLSAQAAQLDGDEAQAREYFQAMLERSETEFLGLRGLLVQANKAGDAVTALTLAERAFALRPQTPWVLTTLLELQTRAGRWGDAMTTLRSAVRQRVMAAESSRRREASLLYEQSRAARAGGEVKEALKLANEARDVAPGFVPAIVAAAELSLESGRRQAAARIVTEGWERAPHPAIGRVFLALLLEDSPLERLKRVERLVTLNPEHPDSHLLLAETAQEAKLWGTARNHLVAAAKVRPSGRVFQLLARLEEAEHGDEAAARRWLLEASRTPPDPVWMCERCGAPGTEWSIACAHCGALDSLVWRQQAAPEVENLASPPPPLDRPAEAKPGDAETKSADAAPARAAPAPDAGVAGGP
jgi:HemY protein